MSRLPACVALRNLVNDNRTHSKYPWNPYGEQTKEAFLDGRVPGVVLVAADVESL